MMALPPDPTLDELRAALAPLVAENAAFDGWGTKARRFGRGCAGRRADSRAAGLPDGPVER